MIHCQLRCRRNGDIWIGSDYSAFNICNGELKFSILSYFIVSDLLSVDLGPRRTQLEK